MSRRNDQIDIGQFLTIAGCIVTVAGSLISAEQQKQANHEIAREVAKLVREDMKRRG